MSRAPARAVITILSTASTNNDPTVQVPSFRPSVDSILEFTVLTGVYPAQYGFGSGGQAVVVTKSGTNNLHGTAYDFLRNEALDARNYFTPAGPKPSYKQNQFGATVGGPIIKNKTFFFVEYEARRYPETFPISATVPTASLRSGILKFRDAAGNVVSYNLATSNSCGTTGTQACDPRGLGISPTMSAMSKHHMNPSGEEQSSAANWRGEQKTIRAARTVARESGAAEKQRSNCAGVLPRAEGQ
jgi:hypothetical protein